MSPVDMTSESSLIPPAKDRFTSIPLVEWLDSLPDSYDTDQEEREKWEVKLDEAQEAMRENQYGDTNRRTVETQRAAQKVLDEIRKREYNSYLKQVLPGQVSDILMSGTSVTNLILKDNTSTQEERRKLSQEILEAVRSADLRVIYLALDAQKDFYNASACFAK